MNHTPTTGATLATLPFSSLLPPDPAYALRMGRCADGVAFWLCPSAAASLPARLRAAWLTQLTANLRALRQHVVHREVTLPNGETARALVLQHHSTPQPSPYSWQQRLIPSLAIDSLPLVRTTERAAYGRRVDPDEDEDPYDFDAADERDAFADYAELSGMSRDEYMNSVD